MNETMNANNANAPTTLKTNLLYALSSVAENPLFTLMMGFLTFFYTDTIGINPAIVGTILMVSRFMDGISDLIAGNIVDHTHTKYGQARPWFLRLMIPVAFAYVVLFTVPNCGTAGKIAYIFISYNLVSTVIYTMFKAAQAVYPTFLTKNRVSRSIMSTMYLFGACAAQMILMMFGIRFVEALGGGQSGWIKFAAILGAIAGAIMLIIFLFTKEMNDGEEEVKQQENVPFKTAILSLLKNKYWFILLATFFAGVIIQVCTLTDGVYYAKYVLNDLGMQTNLTLYFLFPNLVIMLFLPGLYKKGISKKKLCMIGAVLLLIGKGIGIAFPAGIGFIVGLAIRGVGYAMNACCQTAMVFETMVYGEWKTGYNVPGVTMTATGAAQKLGSGIGAALLGITLAKFGYDGMAEVQPAAAVGAINVIYMIVPAVLAVVWLILFYFYKLDEDYPRYVKELEERHAKEKTGAEV